MIVESSVSVAFLHQINDEYYNFGSLFSIRFSIKTSEIYHYLVTNARICNLWYLSISGMYRISRLSLISGTKRSMLKKQIGAKLFSILSNKVFLLYFTHSLILNENYEKAKRN